MNMNKPLINPDIFKLRGKPMKSWDNIVPKEPLSIPKFRYVTLEMPSHIDDMILQFLFQYGDLLIKKGYAYEDNRRNKNSNK